MCRLAAVAGVLLFIYFFLRAALAAMEVPGLQIKSTAAAASLHHSHSNARCQIQATSKSYALAEAMLDL